MTDIDYAWVPEKGDWLHRALTAEEVAEFREYARTHDPEHREWSVYHPVCIEVWRERGLTPEMFPEQP